MLIGHFRAFFGVLTPVNTRRFVSSVPNSSLELGWAERAVEWGKTGILSLAEPVKMGIPGVFSTLAKPSHVL